MSDKSHDQDISSDKISSHDQDISSDKISSHDQDISSVGNFLLIDARGGLQTKCCLMIRRYHPSEIFINW
jgi:hypothetical protein